MRATDTRGIFSIRERLSRTQAWQGFKPSWIARLTMNDVRDEMTDKFVSCVYDVLYDVNKCSIKSAAGRLERRLYLSLLT